MKPDKSVTPIHLVSALVDALEPSPSIGWSSFALDRHQEGEGNSYFKGITAQDILEMVTLNWYGRVPGQGETDCSRKVVVNLPSAICFFIPVVPIVEGLPIRARVTTRQPGEDPYVEKYIDASDAKRLNLEATAADFVSIVCYSAEALLENDGKRSTECDWEIVAVLASKQKTEPMPPLTMARNMLGKVGGTLSIYTAEEFAESIYFHATQNGVKIKKLSKTDKLKEIAEVHDQWYSLKNECPHQFKPLTQEQLDDEWMAEFAYCVACHQYFGWRCNKSPDTVCHYSMNEVLLDGSPITDEIILQNKGDWCLFCGSPEERK